jgi:fibronectin type 3 domain-containing protein
MRRTFTAAIAVAVCALLYGCGTIGEPLYPSLNIPVRIADLHVVEHGNVLIIDFTIPAITTDGVAVKNIQSVELRVGDKVVAVNRSEPGPVHVTTPVEGLGTGAVVHARVINSKGRASEWSNAVTIAIVPPVAPPSHVSAEGVLEGVKLTWSAPGSKHFRIFRRAPDEKDSQQIGESDAPEYVDKTSAYGHTYVYSVQAVNGTAESDATTGGAFESKDIFPPAVPSGLTISPGVNTIELAWDRNTEPDFKGYRVYRSVGDAPFERIADMIEGPSFSDKNVEAGKHYRYTVSAVDQLGNESNPTAPAEITP